MKINKPMPWVTNGNRMWEKHKTSDTEKENSAYWCSGHLKTKNMLWTEKRNCCGHKTPIWDKKYGNPNDTKDGQKRKEAENRWEPKCDQGDRPRPVDIYVSSLNKMKIIKRII